jgi:hypothetical protein
MTRNHTVEGHPVVVRGRIIRIAQLRDEYYDEVQDPIAFSRSLAKAGVKSHLFSALQSISSPQPIAGLNHEFDSAAILRLTTYEHWWKKQINDKTRNMVRKAGKTGVELRAAQFDDEFIHGIVKIYGECPIRQGRKFKHYGKGFDVIKREHSGFLDRSEFFGAFLGSEMIGFIKLVHGRGVSNLMQIISMVSHRDKAPTNALLAKAVERCCERNVPMLHYGTWSRRSMGEFKKHHGFERLEVPRYFIPTSFLGRFALACGLHVSMLDRVPEPALDWMANQRSRWNNKKLAKASA